MMRLSDDRVNKTHFIIGQQVLSEVFLKTTDSAGGREALIQLLNQHELTPQQMAKMDTAFLFKSVQEDQRLPAKMSVTALKRVMQETNKESDLPALKLQPRFMQAEEGLSPEERGTRMHNLLRHLTYSKITTYDQLVEEISYLDDRGIVQTEGLTSVDYQKIMDFFTSPLGQLAKAATQLKRETPFVFKKKIDDEEVLIQGIIDLYFESDEGLVLVDFKTDRISRAKVAARSKLYKEQLTLYKEALETITGKTVVAEYLYFLELGIANKL